MKGGRRRGCLCCRPGGVCRKPACSCDPWLQRTAATSNRDVWQLMPHSTCVVRQARPPSAVSARLQRQVFFDWVTFSILIHVRQILVRIKKQGPGKDPNLALQICLCPGAYAAGAAPSSRIARKTPMSADLCSPRFKHLRERHSAVVDQPLVESDACARGSVCRRRQCSTAAMRGHLVSIIRPNALTRSHISTSWIGCSLGSTRRGGRSLARRTNRFCHCRPRSSNMLAASLYFLYSSSRSTSLLAGLRTSSFTSLVPGEDHPRLDLHQPAGHFQKLAYRIHVQDFQHLKMGKILLGDQ